MNRQARFVAGLVVGLGALTAIAVVTVKDTWRTWVERDLELRGRLVVQGSRKTLADLWSAERSPDLLHVLEEISRDDRILSAGAFSMKGVPVAVSEDFPTEALFPHVATRVGEAEESAAPLQEWKTELDMPDGRAHVMAVPVATGAEQLGWLVLVHDLTFATRREATALRFLLVAFAVLAIAASLVTMIAARLAWRGWRAELQRLLQGEAPRPEFQPILRDVRDLVARIVGEAGVEQGRGRWTPERLRTTLARDLEGERVAILANREPYIHHRTPEGAVEVQHPASGLVTALEPVMRACGGVWIAHGGGNADREFSDAHGRLRVPPGEESYALRRLWLSAEEEAGYYYGFANEGLWPLCHNAHVRPEFRSRDWHHYRAVNQRFADALRQETEGSDPVVLVQDYHFAMAPRQIRTRTPRATVLMFWHIPWPNAERLGICPWREELLAGMLGADILGFQTQLHCNNFLDSVDRYLEARIDREQNAVVHQGRRTLVRPYPISLEWPSRWLDEVPDVATCRAEARARLGIPHDALLGVGVDRLDYTKGIEERLLAVERLLERQPELRGRFTFVQLAAPSRSKIESYRRLHETVEAQSKRINARFDEGPCPPIVLLRSHHEPADVFRFYRASDVCYVSSLHDGMNLVAKEFVSARDDAQGVLVLSQFTGAARELTEALVVNPYDLDEAAAALAAALRMPPEEQKARLEAMRGYLAEFNVYRWAGRMLTDAALLRRRESLAKRLLQDPSTPAPAIAVR